MSKKKIRIARSLWQTRNPMTFSYTQVLQILGDNSHQRASGYQATQFIGMVYNR
jgi:hypothetical protein